MAIERDSVFVNSAVLGSSEVVRRGGAEDARVKRRSNRGSVEGVAIVQINWQPAPEFSALHQAHEHRRGGRRTLNA